jgi:hypothetical protein
LSTEAERRSIGRIFYRFIGALLCSSFLVYLAGNVKPPCDGCGREHGWPLVYYAEAGIVGDAHWVWMGMLGDTALCILFAMALTLLWNTLAQIAKVKIEDEASR